MQMIRPTASFASTPSWTGLSRSTLYRKVQTGTFPAQIRTAQRCTG